MAAFNGKLVCAPLPLRTVQKFPHVEKILGRERRGSASLSALMTRPLSSSSFVGEGPLACGVPPFFTENFPAVTVFSYQVNMEQLRSGCAE